MTHYKEKKFGVLSDVDVGPNGEIVIVDSGNKCVIVFDNKLNLSTVIGQGSGKGKLVNPDGVAVTDKIIAVTDYGSNQVKKYSLSGELLSVIGQMGNNKGQFYKPRGIAFSKNKLLYVVDRGNRRIQVFQQDDTFSFSFGNEGSGPGRLQWPIVIAIDLNNNILVSDRDANCIILFDWLGHFIKRITYSGSNLYAFTVSPTGYIITGHRGSDIYKIKVHSRSPSYQLVNEFGKKGSEEGEFSGIMGIAVDSFGVIYVVEWNNERLHVISTF